MATASAIATTRDLSDLLGVSERHVRRIAAGRVSTEGVRRKEYDLASLPPDVQVAWAAQQKVVPITSTSAGQMGLALTMPVGPNLSDEDRAEAERRYRVIEPLLKPEEPNARAIWALNKGSKVAVVDWLATQHKTARRTIYTWLADFKSTGITALVPKDRSDKGKPKALNAAALEFILVAAFPKHGAYGKLTVRDIFRAYGEERAWRAKHAGKPLKAAFDLQKYARYLDAEDILAPSAQLPEASYRTFLNWYERIPEVARVMAREGDEAFHNSQEIISFRDLNAVKPLDYVVMDHRRLDFFCLIPIPGGWKLARPWLTAAIDMRTRKWLSWVIVETPSSDSIAATLKRCFLEHGLPVSCYWDNGKDFRCAWLEGRTEKVESRTTGEMEPVWRGVLDTLGVRVHHAIVKRARSKIIEPNFGRTADFDRTLPWWCGHQPGARPTERFDKLLDQHERWLTGEAKSPAFPTIAEVAKFYSDHLKELNERDMEKAEGMAKVTPSGRGWMCPNEAWERLIKDVERREVPENVLHMAFAKRKPLKVQHGEIATTFGGQRRHYRMSNPVRLAALNGREVEFAYDPLDLQTAAVYFEGRLVGLVECIELRRMGEDTFVEDEINRRVMRRETKKFITAVHANVPFADHAERHARRAIEARPEPARLVVEAPVPVAIVEAAAELVADRAEVTPVRVALMEPVVSAADGDDEFNFFS